MKRQALIEAEKNLFGVGLTSVVDAGLDVADIRLINEMHKVGVEDSSSCYGERHRIRYRFCVSDRYGGRMIDGGVDKVLHGRCPRFSWGGSLGSLYG